MCQRLCAGWILLIAIVGCTTQEAEPEDVATDNSRKHTDARNDAIDQPDKSPRMPQDVKEVLRIVGQPSNVEVSGAFPTVANMDNETQQRVRELSRSAVLAVRQKGIADGLEQAAIECANFPQDRYKVDHIDVHFNTRPNWNTITDKLGSADVTEPGTVKLSDTSQTTVTWHKYGWVHFGVNSFGKSRHGALTSRRGP